ncbi:MAG: hypothetical protein ACK5MR_12265 [Cumulibacter sp.]
MADLNPHVVLPAHGSIPEDVPNSFATAHRRVARLVNDPSGAVW